MAADVVSSASNLNSVIEFLTAMITPALLISATGSLVLSTSTRLGRVVDRARRPSFLFNPSNDAWFGAWGPPQHLAQARLRAIEEGIAVIRATPNGISVLISPTGRLLATVPRHQAGVIDAFVPEPLPPALFARFGLWTSALFGALLLLIGIAVRRVMP